MQRSDLLTRVLEDLDREDISDDTQSFWLKRAEQRIQRELRVREMVKREVINLADSLFPLPDDFLQVDDLEIYPLDTSGNVVGGPRELEYKPPHELTALRRAYEKTAIPGGQAPSTYSLTGKNIELFPAPTMFTDTDGAMWQLNMAYYAKLEPLVLDTDTNWLLEDNYNVYFNAVRIFGFEYLKEDDRASMMEQKLVSDIMVLNAASEIAPVTGRLVARTTTPIGTRRSANWR